MKFNLLPVLNYEGKRLPVDISVDIESRSGDQFKALTPAAVKGEIVNIGGCLELNALCTVMLELVCDRCGDSFSRELEFRLEERFRKEETEADANENPDITILEGNEIEIDGIVYDGLALSLPTKILCREECKGLCVSCGKNLNGGPCGCGNEPTDPRFDVLDKLL